MERLIPTNSQRRFYPAAILLTFFLCGTVILVTAANIIMASWHQSTASREFLRSQAYSIGILAAAGSANGVIFHDRALFERTVTGIGKLPGFQWMIIRDAAGDTLYTAHVHQAPEAFRKGATVMPQDSTRILEQSSGEVIVLAPVHGPVEEDRRGEVVIALKTNTIIDTSNRTRTAIISSGIAVSVIAILFGFFVVRQITKSVQNHVAVAERATMGDLTQRISENFSVFTPKETVIIHRAFNRMLDSLEQQQEEMRIKNERLQELTSSLMQANIQMELYTKELEQKNRQIEAQNNELQMLNAEKNEFLGIVAHDLKNPISAIQGLATILEEQSESPEMIRSISKTMLQSADRMLELVRNLLDINRLERGAWTYELQPVNPTWVIMPIVEGYLTRAEAKSITLHFSPPEHSIICLADMLAFSQVVDNLVSNAIKYSPQGKNVWIDIERHTDTVRVIVRDEGPGLSDDDKKKLFGKFARLSAQPTGGEHSTGLGLSIVKRMVEAMNGRVWCESELGKGAAFIVELPALSLVS
ncbi:MAG: HAMP domain-containing sensor histidine kinase [Bacteroidota bacterium]|nr:HAMP domain-containing histidine kinase [Candidatus Kapabacteria bacterium]MDW8220509.1 HAMP domain-containing sensor histidine kinase [Bacteroidota bacterium]